ncbi:uncharacterized protein BXZ73DRAFT_98570 [Epithele typhae]|uniref:uncharacterized protein n=1 Tax=Epithele typhae TaxID=378194 RepID=UPI0020085185|nr:uncharacterized protein BXZ73DRAFT_98570 [Epithele typhae]KAH9940740.1 hypothetical protein BXZ73DRAFT_98570 [Epithele typhae]
MLAFVVAAALLAGSQLVRAEPVPTAPGPGDVFTQGGKCSFSWTPDTTGTWKTMNVELMTGGNLGMVHLTTVATLDGTDPATTSYEYDCPEVSPNSAIYFYQFSTPAAPKNLTWTTRFTIAAADGTTATPTESDTSQVTTTILFGTGSLVDAAAATAAPGYLNGATAATTTTTTPGSTAATTTATSAGSKITTSHSSAPAAPTSAKPSTTSNTTSSADNSGAIGAGADGLLASAGAALVVAALAFSASSDRRNLVVHAH